MLMSFFCRLINRTSSLAYKAMAASFLLFAVLTLAGCESTYDEDKVAQ